MDSEVIDNNTIGIIANPASGQDIRRLVSAASGLSIAEKTNIIRRLCLGMWVFGINKVYMIPDKSGIAGSLLRGKDQGLVALGEGWPEIELLDMPVEEKAIDTLRAVDLMVKSRVRLIIVLGGDGTHRLVANNCGNIPIIALSTGTNNTFPHFHEATNVGMAAGLVARGAILTSEVTRRNKILHIEINGLNRDVALVDLCLVDDLWIGSRALWKPERVKEIFVTFAEADAIGWSSVAGLIHPISRESDQGLHLTLCSPGQGQLTIYAPIAPGLIVPVGVKNIRILKSLQRATVELQKGIIALDGEREFAFSPTDKVNIWLDLNGPLTIDVSRVLKISAERGFLNYPSPYIRY